MDILGVRVDNLGKNSILHEIKGYLENSSFHQIATVNPEFILLARNNRKFRDILNLCDLNVADGFGIKLAFWRHGKHLKSRLAGAGLMLGILRLAQEMELGVFLACRKEGLSSWKETREAILRICPKLIIEGDDIDPKDTSYNIRGTSRVLFCNFGAPEQELFIRRQNNGIIRLGIGIGGGFDFLTKKVRRSPKFLRQIGLEWFWRLIQPQPWEFKKQRIKRVFRAVVIFPIRVMLDIKHK